MNKYDEGYNTGLQDSCVRRSYYVYSNHYHTTNKTAADPDFSAGLTDAHQAKQRDSNKSDLAKDENYQKFLSLVKEVVGSKIEYIEVHWCTGGMTGGSCWGDDPQPRESDQPEELTQLDQIIEKVSPDISFLKYKNLCAEIVHTDTYTQNEYYGNSYNYIAKFVLMHELYEALKARKLLDNVLFDDEL